MPDIRDEPALEPPRLLWAAGARLGESPTWDDRTGRLWWLDVHGRRLHAMDAAGAARRSWDLPEEPGCLALTDDPGVLLLGLRDGLFACVPEDGPKLLPVAMPEGHDPRGHRLNDGRADPSGRRFWFGTMHDAERAAEGALHVLEEGRATRVEAGLAVPNGPAFTADGRRMFLADSPARTIHAFGLDAAGMPADRHVLTRFADGEGLPDGMAVDAEGCLWVAQFGAGRVVRLHPGDGRRLGGVVLPVENVTSLVFGGADLSTLFVTSAGGSGRAEEGAAGGVFAVRLAVTGLPMARFGWNAPPGPAR